MGSWGYRVFQKGHSNFESPRLYEHFKSIFKVASIFGQREGPLDVECPIYIYFFNIVLTVFQALTSATAHTL